MPLIPNMPAREYHAKPGASASRLKLLRERSPLHVRYAIDNPKPPTPALVLGEALHTKVMEPDQYGKRFVVPGTCVGVTKEGKPCNNEGKIFDGQWWCGVHGKGRTRDEGRTILTADDNITVHSMERAILAHPNAAALLSVSNRREVSIFWTDPLTGCDCKARLDLLADDVGIITDIKTCDDASAEGFSKQIANYQYDIQARHYMAACEAVGIEINDFFFIAVEKEKPHAVAVRRMADSDVQAIDGVWRQLLKQYHQCATSGKWPGYDEAEEVAVPKWRRSQIERAQVA